MKYIGIDLGTSAVKLLRMDGDGTIEKIVSRQYPIFYPRPGWSEQNPQDWFAAVVAGLKELLADCDKSKVVGISFGGQMHGLVVLDEKDAVIRPAILWNDGRTGEECRYLNEEIGRERLLTATGNIAFAGFTAPKLLWMYRHERELFARIKKVMLPKDYLAYRLCGVFCSDVSDASGTLLYDVAHRCWSQEMLELCHLKEAQMGRVYESDQTVGTLLPAVAAELGLSPAVRVAAGAGDNAAAAVGTGTVGEGACNLSLGTSGTVFLSSAAFRADPFYALHAFAHADGGYHLMGCMLSAASCSGWWIRDILKNTDLSAEQALVDETRLGENPVYFLPYLMGERSPHNDPNARGTFVGMTMDTTRSDLTQAVLEGVSFGLRDSLEAAKRLGVAVTRARICGGGAKSALWKKIVANSFNLPLEVLQVEEGPALGAAMLAAVSCGEYGSVEEAARRIVQVKETICPDPSLAEKYEQRYREFTKLYPALKPVYAVLGHEKR